MAWTALLFAAIGFATNFHTLLILAALAGFGSGAFHPLGALNARAVIPPAQRNSAMSIYVTGGTFGFALGPLVGAAVFGLLGMKGTAAMILPGVVIGLWLLANRGEIATIGSRRRAPGDVEATAPLPLFLISVVIFVMMLRMVPIVGGRLHPRLVRGSRLQRRVLRLAGDDGGARQRGRGDRRRAARDRYGRRNVILVTLIASVLPVWLFARFPGPQAFVSGALIGLLAASTAPLLLVMAQQLMIGRAGMASGLILGLSFIAGAISAPLFGMLADSIGLQNAMQTLPLVVLVTIGVAWFLPTERQMDALAEEVPLAPPPAPTPTAEPSPETGARTA